MNRFVIAAVTVLSGVAVTPAHAAYINSDANSIVSQGGEAFIRFDGREAGHTTNVYSGNSGAFLFNNQTTASGSVFSLGTFAAGQTISFTFNNVTSGHTYFSGLASENVDNAVHVSLAGNADGSIALGYEDLYGGGDFDFNDITATVFENIIETPLPGTAWLILSGLAGLGFAARQKKPDYRLA